MRIGFIIPVLNAADHLAGTLAQINDYGRTVVIEFVDPIVDIAESNNGRSLDNTHKIVEAFDGVTLFSMGKVRNRCSALNKGLRVLSDAEYIIVLQQGDIFLDIQYLMEELRHNDIISTRRFRLWHDFEHYCLGREEEIAFKNIRGFGELRYNGDPYAVTLSNGHALKDHNVRTICIDNILANFRMVTSEEKRERMLYREQREIQDFSFGPAVMRDFCPADVEQPSLQTIDETVSFLNLVPHPWRKHDKDFLDNLPIFPSVGVDEWLECFDDDYVAAFVGERDFSKPRVLGFNCNELSSQFEAEGWEFSDEPTDKYDLICCVGVAPDMSVVTKYLKEHGRIIGIDIPRMISDPQYRTVFLEKREELFSFAIMRSSENG